MEYRTLRLTAGDQGVLRVTIDVPPPSADAIRADARRFRDLVASDAAPARTAALFAQGLPTRGSLELNLGDRLGSP
jgi:hypothetical protein